MITLVNTQAERLFGYARDELTGRPEEVLFPERARGIHAGHRRGYLASPSPVPRPMGAGQELTARRKDGSEFPSGVCAGEGLFR